MSNVGNLYIPSGGLAVKDGYSSQKLKTFVHLIWIVQISDSSAVYVISHAKF